MAATTDPRPVCSRCSRRIAPDDLYLDHAKPVCLACLAGEFPPPLHPLTVCAFAEITTILEALTDWLEDAPTNPAVTGYYGQPIYDPEFGF